MPRDLCCEEFIGIDAGDLYDKVSIFFCHGEYFESGSDYREERRRGNFVVNI
jgi:hypothetical protein